MGRVADRRLPRATAALKADVPRGTGGVESLVEANAGCRRWTHRGSHAPGTATRGGVRGSERAGRGGFPAASGGERRATAAAGGRPVAFSWPAERPQPARRPAARPRSRSRGEQRPRSRRGVPGPLGAPLRRRSDLPRGPSAGPRRAPPEPRAVPLARPCASASGTYRNRTLRRATPSNRRTSEPLLSPSSKARTRPAWVRALAIAPRAATRSGLPRPHGDVSRETSASAQVFRCSSISSTGTSAPSDARCRRASPAATSPRRHAIQPFVSR